MINNIIKSNRSKCLLNEFLGGKVEERVSKAKSTNYMPARTSRKVEILEQGKNFSGQCYVKLNRAVREVEPFESLDER